MELLAASAASINLQVIVFHHNEQGSNGKSSTFTLIKAGFGELMVKCAASALVAPAGGGGNSGPNEELASVQGKRIVQFTEPNALHRLNVSFIKDLTGGDEQSARRNYEHKRTFVFNGMAHVPCNKIPQMDDMCGGGQRRIRSMPYGSRFVDAPSGPDAPPLPPHHYYKESGLAEKFEKWKYCLMSEVLAVAVEKAMRPAGAPWHNSVPAVVVKATEELIRRENAVMAFYGRRLARSPHPKDVLKLSDVSKSFSAFCIRKKFKHVLLKDVKGQLSGLLGEMVVTSNNGVRNYWVGWRLLDAPPMGAESDDELDVVDPGSDADDPLGD